MIFYHSDASHEAGCNEWWKKGLPSIIDVGGESTRPGAQSVTETEELDRVIPVD